MAGTLTAERLRDLLDYNQETGVFVWKSLPGNGRAVVGLQAGCVAKKRYQMISIDGKTYLSHRLAWFYVNGKWPKSWIDHINRDRLDNRIANLREATPEQSARNRPGHRGRALPKGVYKRKYGFESWIMQSGVHYYLGHFASENAAASAYANAARSLHKEFAQT